MTAYNKRRSRSLFATDIATDYWQEEEKNTKQLLEKKRAGISKKQITTNKQPSRMVDNYKKRKRAEKKVTHLKKFKNKNKINPKKRKTFRTGIKKTTDKNRIRNNSAKFKLRSKNKAKKSRQTTRYGLPGI